MDYARHLGDNVEENYNYLRNLIDDSSAHLEKILQPNIDPKKHPRAFYFLLRGYVKEGEKYIELSTLINKTCKQAEDEGLDSIEPDPEELESRKAVVEDIEKARQTLDLIKPFYENDN